MGWTFEALLTLLALGIGVFLIGIPFYKLVKSVIPPKRNPLEEAKERLEQARLEAEAVRLNKETEKLYSELYKETLEDDTESETEKDHRRL
jgi:hypothetical protein